MLQESTAAAPAAAGGNNAAALQQMGFDHLITQLDAVGWIVFVTLMVMSLMSWYWIIINAVKNSRMRGRAETVTATFWETANAQDAIRFMEEQPKSSRSQDRARRHEPLPTTSATTVRAWPSR
jgi:biopolymer transport protein ExbB